MTQNIFFLSLKFIIVDLIGEAFYFPLWWYTRGVKIIARWCLKRLKLGEQRLGLGIWIKNIFTPMYGQRDYAGMVISFFVRLVEIAARFVLLILWLIILLAIFLFWLVFPIFTVYQIYAQLFVY